ncbi:hypothetical protein BCU92_00245 [Vibrio cyclitrophicus]|uniref:hypothetical protein n=1 Tax=Vibrio TaxID=662 RepID=UPI000C829B0A|nr:hypothetical protein [Vibrio cyclitrophicus]PMG40234.1 hypothetical protein BCU92_17715 [Vibrio cyclitrophicus]
MRISNSREFRLAVLYVEDALKSNHYLPIVNFAYGIERNHPRSAALIDMAINKIILNRSGYLTFEQTQASRLCKSFELRQKLAKHRPSLRLQLRTKKRIRKQQEDTPAQGVESHALGGEV